MDKAEKLLHSSSHPSLSPSSSLRRSQSKVRQKLQDFKEKQRRRHNRIKRKASTASDAIMTSSSRPASDERRASIASDYSFDEASWSGSEYDSSSEDEQIGSIAQQVSPTGSLPANLDLAGRPADQKSTSAASSSVALGRGPGIDRVRTLQSNLQGNSAAITGPSFLTSVFSAAQTAANTLSTLTTGVTNSMARGIDSPLASTENSPMTTPNLSSDFPHGRPRAETEPIPRKSAEFDDSTPSVARTVATIGSGHLTLESIVEGQGSNENGAPGSIAGGYSLNDENVQSEAHESGAATPANPAFGESTTNLANTERSNSKRNSMTRRRGSTASQMPTPTGLSSIAPQISQQPRVTGFAVANKKRNREFHQLFRSVPEDDYLIEDYGCALSREILLQGRLYISEQHICFNSNIFGWVTNLVISFDEVVAIEKKTTAGLFPNAIVVQTLHARNVFASFISRDSTYELMCSIWHNGELPSGTPSGSSDEESDSEREEADGERGGDGSDADGDGNSGDGDGDGKGNGDGLDEKQLELIGPLKHAPTTCGCPPNEHYEKIVCDEKFNVPVGRLCTLLWGDDSTWMMNYTTNTLKNFDMTKPTPFEPDAQGHRARTFSYIKPLNASIGPKQTKCLTTETLTFWDFNDHVTVVVSTETPDVPNGNLFVTKTKYCITWAENNTTRMLIMCTVEWSGKSWIKGPIEKGANEGQAQSAKDLVAALNHEFQPKATTKSKKKKQKSKGTKKSEPVKQIRQPVHETEKKFDGTYITYIVIGLLVLVLIQSTYLIFGGRGSSRSRSNAVKKWDALWDIEEQYLWDWIEDRTQWVGAKDGVTHAKDVKPRGWLSRHEVEEAIAITQQRLDFLRSKLHIEEALVE
ncbi:hypothetical protein BZA70DRAFT_255488 [Myxozyma melibiosi]|uniref:VASt domain-containing protein n=1 Tax=Myxozyma melibiosi TaxID=54550 RepID=A0ABR1FAF7_9ASCO